MNSKTKPSWYLIRDFELSRGDQDFLEAQARVEDPLVGETFEERLASIMEFHRFLRNGGFEHDAT